MIGNKNSLHNAVYLSKNSLVLIAKHVQDTVQNTHRRALLFIDNRQFIGFLHKQSLAVSTVVR